MQEDFEYLGFMLIGTQALFYVVGSFLGPSLMKKFGLKNMMIAGCFGFSLSLYA